MVFTALLFDDDRQFVAKLEAQIGDLRPPQIVFYNGNAHLRRDGCEISGNGERGVGFYYGTSHWMTVKDDEHPDGAFVASVEK